MSRRPISRRIYRVLLCCYPSGLRRRYAAEMEDAFVESMDIVARRRRLGPAYAWGAALVDVVGAWRAVLAPESFRGGNGRGVSGRGSGTDKEPERIGRLAQGWADCAYAMRSLRRDPGFSCIAVATLALGIGANAALFTVVNAVLLQPLPYPSADQLVAINITLRDNTWWSASPYEIRSWRQRNEVFDEIAFAQAANMTLVAGEDPIELPGATVSGNLFDALQVQALLGRGFNTAEGEPGGELVAVLSHGAWASQFGGDSGVVGSIIRLDGVERTVIGVLPAEATLAFLGGQQVYVPAQFDESMWVDRGKNLRAVGRLGDDATFEQARADMHRVALQMEIDDAPPDAGWGVLLVPLHEQVVGSVRGLLWLLFGTVAFVLLIACANTSNLLLARAVSQRHEFAVRRALGAGSGRVFRQLLTESCLLAIAGGAAGLLLALWGTEVLLSLVPGTLPLQPELGADVRVLLFTLLASLASGLALGLLPAYRVAVIDPGSALRSNGRSSAGSGMLKLRSALVAFEVAVVLVLLVGAGLTLRSFEQLFDVDPGFEVERRLAMRITLPQATYPGPNEATAFFDELREQIGALPGVAGIGTVSTLPFSSLAGFTGFHIIEGRPLPESGTEPIGGVEAVSAGYFETMRIPLLRGRLIEAADDRPDAAQVAVINEAMWRLYWPDGADPIGDKVLFAPPSAPAPFSVPREIVGVVRGVKYGLGADIRPRVYTPGSQLPFTAGSRFLVVETVTDAPEALAPAIRAAVRDIDPDQSVAVARTLTGWRAQSLARDRFQTTLLALFGGAALLLGAAGVYGVVSYSVNQRRREAGIRMALGASAGSVLRWVLRAAMAPVLLGVAIGLAGALALAGLMDDMLFEVDPRDPLTLVAVPVVLLLVAAIASIVPARRAGRVDPVESLRAD